MKPTTTKTSKRNKKIALIAVAIVLAIVLGGFAVFKMNSAKAPDGSAAYTTVTPKQAVELIRTKKDLVVIDIRNGYELKEGWVEGSIFMPMQDIIKGRETPPKDKPILLICAVGGRSLGLGQAMASYGWPEIYNLQGGIAEWKRQGLPLKYK
jgi:rhodanese-related sulfurtransferase